MKKIPVKGKKKIIKKGEKVHKLKVCSLKDIFDQKPIKKTKKTKALDGDGISITSISHPKGKGIRGRKIKSSSVETVEIEVDQLSHIYTALRELNTNMLYILDRLDYITQKFTAEDASVLDFQVNKGNGKGIRE